MTPDPEKTPDDRVPAWRKLFGQGAGKAEEDSSGRQFLEAPAGPRKTAAALRLLRRMLAGGRSEPAATREAIRYLERRVPRRLEHLLGGLDAAIAEPEAVFGAVDEAEAELLELAQDTAALEAAGEPAGAEALERIANSRRATELLELLRDLRRAEEDGAESVEEAAYSAAALAPARRIPKLIHKGGRWVVANPPPEAEVEWPAYVAAAHELPQPGQRLGPWVLGEIAEVVAADAKRKIQKIPLSLDLPDYGARIQLQVRPDIEDYGRQETWVYEVYLAAPKSLEIEVGWGNQTRRTSGWEPLGGEPVQSMFDPPTADPVWLYLRCRSGGQWLESREEIPMLKERIPS